MRSTWLKLATSQVSSDLFLPLVLWRHEFQAVVLLLNRFDPENTHRVTVCAQYSCPSFGFCCEHSSYHWKLCCNVGDKVKMLGSPVPHPELLNEVFVRDVWWESDSVTQLKEARAVRCLQVDKDVCTRPQFLFSPDICERVPDNNRINKLKQIKKNDHF